MTTKLKSKKATASQNRGIRISASRMVPTMYMQTVAGEQVYRFGYKGFTLERMQGKGQWASPRQKVSSYDDSAPERVKTWRAAQLAAAQIALGVECEWIQGAPTEMMDVYF